MASSLLTQWLSGLQYGTRQFAVLIDPDKHGEPGTLDSIASGGNGAADLWLVGGSLLRQQNTETVVTWLKEKSSLPVVLFPGSNLQVTDAADAILLLSLISGRNAELLIGRHVEVAPLLKMSGLEIIPTGYILVDGGAPTSVSYMSNTTPIPANKPEIAACTALAGCQLGMKAIYLDAGSGARRPVSADMVQMVKAETGAFVIVGGGIRDAETAYHLCDAGADMIVVGTVLEDDPSLLAEMAHAVHSFNPTSPA